MSRRSPSSSRTGDHNHSRPSSSRTTAIRVGNGKPYAYTIGPSAIQRFSPMDFKPSPPLRTGHDDDDVGAVNHPSNVPPRWRRSHSTVSYTHLRAHETGRNLVCRLLLEQKKLA